MLRKLLLISVLLMFLAPAAFAGGGFEELPQMAQHIVDDGEGMSPEVVAALILGGLGLTGAIVTALLNGRRKRG